MTDTQLVKRDEALFPTTFEGMMKQVTEIAKSGLFGIAQPAQVLAMALQGRELGLGIMESIRSLYIVNQKVAMTAGLMAALVQRAGHKFEVLERTDKKCVIKFYRKDTNTVYEQIYTIDHAQKAGLVNKDNWKKYPEEMLYARCFSTGARIMYADVLYGIYTPEEMGANTNNAGEVIDSGANAFDAQATKEILLKQLTGWYPNKSALVAVWKEYLANHALDIAWKEITIPQLQDFLKWADPAVQSGKVVDAVLDDTGVTPSDAEMQADKEAEARKERNKERNKDKTRTRKPKPNPDEISVTPPDEEYLGFEAEVADGI